MEPVETTESGPPPGPAGDARRAEHYRRQLDALAQNATLALFIMDEHQRCTYMNPAAEQLTGYTLAEVQGKALHDYVHHTRPDGTPYPLEECPIDRAFPQNMREQGEETFVHRDGRFYPVAFTASPIRDGGRTVGTIIEARDITEERRAEAERRRLVTELELERNRLRTVFQQSPAFIAMIVGQDHVFEMANPPYYQLVGHRDIVGRPVREALPEVVEQGFLELLDGVYRTGQPYVGTEMGILLQREPGGAAEERFVNFVYQPLPGPDGRTSGILAHGVDVTGQVRARYDVERLEERLRLALDAADVGTYDWDLAGGALNWDPRARRIFGVPRDGEVTYDTFLEVIHPDDAERATAAVGAALDPSGKGEFAADYRVVWPAGDVRWVRAGGRVYFEGRGADRKPARFLGTVQDITERRGAEAERERLIAELETGQARLRQIFAEAPAVMALYSGPEHVVSMVNPTWERTVGKPGAVGRPFREVFREFEGTGLFEMLDRVYQSGEPFHDPEVNVPLERFGSGVLEDTWWNLVWRPLAGGGARGRDILVHAVEVTAQVRARKEVEAKADELGRLARQLEASNKELDQFAYVASHDLKAPLRGIANLSSWIEEDLGDRVTDEAREHLELLRGRVHRMEGLIDGILAYSRAGRVREEPEMVDVQALLEEAEDLLALPGGFEVRVPEPLPRMVTERLPLQQVFMNLIGNAAKYNTSPRPRVQITSGDLGAAFEFSVADNGPGIAPEYHERIFGIFQTLQARDKVEGTGIGLSLVKKLVESRGGRIWVESPPDGGATFRFTWPRRRDDGSGG
jgi:PAS domain S-box-containing protein